jgi:uracil phosphoribosyltransferase
MYRSRESLLPIQYYNKLPKNQACDVAFVVDPMIATSNTITGDFFSFP